MEQPNAEMPEGIGKNYEGAARIFDASPRSSAALVRLALREWMIPLKEKGKISMPISLHEARKDFRKLSGKPWIFAVRSATMPCILDNEDNENNEMSMIRRKSQRIFSPPQFACRKSHC